MSVEDPRLQSMVHLPGIPSNGTAADVIAFFSGLGLDIDESSVKLNFSERRGAGKAIVTFKTPEDAQKALTKDREFFNQSKFGTRCVRVLAGNGETSEEQTTSVGQKLPKQQCAPSVVSHPPGTVSGVSSLENQKTAIKISNLPPDISIGELVQLFWGVPAKPSNTVVRRDPSQPHAHAYMELGAPEHAAHAVPLMNGTVVTTVSGIFTISVRAASHLEYKTAASATAPPSTTVTSKKNSALGSEDTAVMVKVRGLPLKASLSDILAFFQGYKIKYQQPTPGASPAPAIHIQPLNGENRQSKVAYVEFETPLEADRALEKNQTNFGKAFGDRYCLLQKMSLQEVMAEIARNNQTPGPVYSNHTSFSNGSLDFTTSCASPTAFFNQMMSPPAAALHPPLPYPQMPWGVPLPGYLPPQMHAQFAANMLMQQQQQLFSAGMPMAPPPPELQMLFWQQQQQQARQPPQQPPQPPQQQTYAARYMVQDLSTGQKVFLDPRFNLYTGGDSSGGGGAPSQAGPPPPGAMLPPPPLSRDQLVPNFRVAAQFQQQAQKQQPLPSVLPAATAATTAPSDNNDGSHRTTAGVQIAGEQGSNEGSEEGQAVEHSPDSPLATLAAAAAEAQGNKRSDQGSEDGNKDAVHHGHHHRHHHHHHHYHADDAINNNTTTENGGSGGASAAGAVVVPPRGAHDHHGHKRMSMEVDLPEDDRPIKH